MESSIWYDFPVGKSCALNNDNDSLNRDTTVFSLSVPALPKRRRNLDKRRGTVYASLPQWPPSPPLRVQTGYAQVHTPYSVQTDRVPPTQQSDRIPPIQQSDKNLGGGLTPLSGSVSYLEEEEEDSPNLESFCREATPLTDMSDEQLRPIFWQVISLWCDTYLTKMVLTNNHILPYSWLRGTTFR